METVELEPKTSGAVQLYSADFSNLLAEGESISSSTCAASTYSGTDAAPTTILDGSSVISGNLIQQLITGGVEGVIYQLLFTATTSEDQVLTRTGYLAVVPPLVG